MPLAAPPDAADSLARFPSTPFAGRTLVRVWRHRLADGTERDSGWWFASRASVETDPAAGRYDLPHPAGTCYLADSQPAAVLEAFQAHLPLLPVEELQVRSSLVVTVPSPTQAADLTAKAAAGYGITAAVWARSDRDRTQQWAAALRRDGWWAMQAGVHHDPSGDDRAYALFDRHGAHPPTHAGDWTATTAPLDCDELTRTLHPYGVTVLTAGNLPSADLPGDATWPPRPPPRCLPDRR